MEPKITTPVVKGVIITLILIVFGLVMYFTGQFENRALGSIQYLILFGGIVWGCVQYANQMNGAVTFGNVFSHGFKTTAVIIVLLSIYTFLSFKFIFPDIQEKIIESARQKMESDNKMSDEQIQQAIDLTRKFFLPFAIGGIIIGFGILGALASLLGAAVAKKNPHASTPFTAEVNQIGEIQK